MSRSGCSALHGVNPNLKKNSIFIQPTDREEKANIISSLNINKTCGPFSIPNKVLILLWHDISKQLADLFNLIFLLALFHLYLKLQR